MNQSIFEPDPQHTRAVRKMHMSPLLKFVLEMGPLLIFFIVNFRGQWLIDNVPLFSSFDKPIYPATSVFMVAIITALVISWSIARKIPVMPLVSGIFVLIFGFLTLWLHDDIFIKMKPTFINSLFAFILFGGLLFKKSLLGYVLDSAFTLDAEGWRKPTLRWAWFMLFLAALNEVVWRNFSDEFWTSFKVFGTVPITLVFIITQAPLLMRHAIEPPGNKKQNSGPEIPDIN